MEETTFKLKYQKYKFRVKLWEKDFKKKHGRIPSKYDIREASEEIRYSYKMYYKLKTSFLEDTLNDVLSDDGFDVLEMSQKDVDMDTSLNGGPQLPLDIANLVEQEQHVNSGSTSQENYNGFCNIDDLTTGFAPTNYKNRNSIHVLKEFEPVKFLALNDSAWGPNLATNVKTRTSDKKEVPRKNLKKNIEEKLFKNSSFSKRNPRKSLSKSGLDNSFRGNESNTTDTLNISNKEVLPDLETILLQKAKEQQTSVIISSSPLLTVDKFKNNIKTHVDERWLERNVAQNQIKTLTKEIHNQKEDDNQSLTKRNSNTVYGLTNIDISKLQIKPVPVTEQETYQKVGHSNNYSSLEVGNAKLPEFLDLPLEQDNSFRAKSKSNDSDSVVDDSEEENDSQEYRHIVKRRKVPPSLTKEVQGKIRVGQSNKNKSHLKGNLSESLQESERKNTKSKKKNPIVKDEGELICPAKEIRNNNLEETKISKKTKSRTSMRSSKKETNIVKLQSEDFESKPLDPKDLRYNLVLERGDLTSIPRMKQTDLENADNLAKKYINSTPSITTSASLSTQIPLTATQEKRAAARRKLQDKITAGKLNENFVTINIQKKKFIRGKKTINYSKYKKKLWKHKKYIAALSGPNMDMGGCDGGTLKCFNCGQAGHFAQNCGIKGDSLLPLTAQLEEDVSPFLTLEEAERMASQSAAAVHSRNLAKMPRAPNSAIYNKEERENSDTSEDEVKVSTVDSDIYSATDKGNLPKEVQILMETDDELENVDIDSMTLLENQKSVSPIKKYIASKIPEEFLKAIGIDPKNSNSNNAQFPAVGPLYDLNADGSVKEVTAEVLETLKMFGHTNFRKGQDRAVMRILSGMSTLVTLSTGSGKSLCYQLPAYLYSKYKKSITLVVSPLVSLMEDQVIGVPHFLRAYCLHTNQTPQQKSKIMQLIAASEIDVLLVSPEAVVSGERSTGFGSILKELPPIAFACIDEAHCVSQWSHNFRPSYLMICKVLKQNLGVKCILGLTATATFQTRISIINHLGIKDGEKGVISDTPIPDNLILSISKDENRDYALLQLLLSNRFEGCQSIIIYCTRRDECERVVGYIRTCLQDRSLPEVDTGRKKRKRVNWQAEPYHAGLPASRRRTIQNAFMNNELRIVVATIAFGMGINKPDIRAVIHYNMPRNFESYVQEVGRAGRDNKISHCHLFLDANGGDQNELKRHIYANSLDRHVIRKLLQNIFVPCSCDKNHNDLVKLPGKSNEICKNIDSDTFIVDDKKSPRARPHICQGHEIGFSIEKTVEALDIPEENISTLLCYLEMDNRWCINVLSNAYMKAKIISYGGPKYLKYAAKNCAPLAMAIAMEIKKGCFKEDANIIEFSVIDIAAAIGWNSGVVKYQLKNLEWVQVNGYSKRSPITVSFYDLGFRIKAPGDFTAEEIDDALDTLYIRSVKQEQTQLIQLQCIFQGLSSVAYNSYGSCCNETFLHDRSDQLKSIIRDYFRNDYPKSLKLETDPLNTSNAELESDILALINMYPENNFSGRNVARIFHGISSPNYPALMWYRCKFWRVHSKTDFNHIVQLANSVIIRRRT